MNDTTALISKVPKLEGQLKYENEGTGHLIEKGTIFKYPKELLILCQLYCNDFHCGHYVIPELCAQRNRETWHFPMFCVDLNDKQVSWPSEH